MSDPTNPPPPHGDPEKGNGETETIHFSKQLEHSFDKLKDAMEDLRIDLKKEIQSAVEKQVKEMSILEKKISDEQTAKLESHTTDCDLKSKTQEDRIGQLELKNDKLVKELHEANDKIDSQDYRLSTLEELVEQIQKENIGFPTNENSKTTDIPTHDLAKTALKTAQDALLLANAVEAHGRRWAIRIRGLPAPPKQGESRTTSKGLVVNFLKKELKMNDIAIKDIDCAHRIGYVKDKKQTLLARFFARDAVEDILVKRRDLKGKPFVVHEDTTSLNRNLINELNALKETNLAWCTRGTVWTKLTEDGKKFKLSIIDDITQTIEKNRSTVPRTPKGKNVKKPTTEEDSLTDSASPEPENAKPEEEEIIIASTTDLPENSEPEKEITSTTDEDGSNLNAFTKIKSPPYIYTYSPSGVKVHSSQLKITNRSMYVSPTITFKTPTASKRAAGSIPYNSSPRVTNLSSPGQQDE
jgi:hypothetical protein